MHCLQTNVDGVEQYQGGLGPPRQSSLVDMSMEALAQYLQKHDAKFGDEWIVDGTIDAPTYTYEVADIKELD